MTKIKFANYIENSEFSELFLEQGWDNFNFDRSFEINKTIYKLSGVAQKRNFPIIQCIIPDKIPDVTTRKQLEKSISKLYFEHLIIFISKNKHENFWQLPLYEDNKLKKLVTFSWHKGQDVEGLFQKLRNIVFELKEEEYITLHDVKERVNIFTANSDQIIKKFYTEFAKEHKNFLEFIKGIDDALPNDKNVKKQWYGSLMLNRLMFCYFIQKKGFLDWNVNYLKKKLEDSKKLTGKNNFYGFYRSFLLQLFHDELGRPKEKRKKTESLIKFGNIPYLNGGLFDVHELENTYQKITIKDEAFEKIFNFFDKWNWHLDTRLTASGRDINPDVIGYIFEKYINQKEMGAYYTKEDITDYIGKNTIIPFLLEKVKSYYPEPFKPGYGFWQFLQDSSEEYNYDSVKKGAEGCSSIDEVKIPENIRNGLDTTKPNLLERRKDWNTLTSTTAVEQSLLPPPPYNVGLPTEIWRETITRLQRFFVIKSKIEKGEINEINDLITYNLNIRKLIQDYLEQTQDSKFIREFYKALCSITILDPTCGSGAFLFAALNILQPLYETCIHRMEEIYNANPKGNTDFKERLADVKSENHPNVTYYIYKMIILHNLHGVDIMKEAVEIAKLRLFLKLVAEVDPSKNKPNFGLEPLPDIDFNIRSGNTLVGFATEQQLEEIVRNTEGELIYKEKFNQLKDACKTVAKYYEHFQELQTKTSLNSDEHKKSKESLIVRLNELNENLNRYLADTYGLGKQTQWKNEKEKEKAYLQWKESHQPFHWFAEFYEIIRKGGFDVVIGNPPYVEYSKIKNEYKIKNYNTEKAGNIYAYVIERSLSIMHIISRIGMIIQLSAFCTSRMLSFQEHWLLYSKQSYISFFDDRPGKLFDGLEHIRVAICLNEVGDNSTRNIYTTNYIKFPTETRSFLFDNIAYISNNSFINNAIPKINKNIEQDIIFKIHKDSKKLSDFFNNTGKYLLYFHNAPQYFIRALSFTPYFWNEKEGEKISSHNKKIIFSNETHRDMVLSVLNSTIFYFSFILKSDCRDFNLKEINEFSLDLDSVSVNNISMLKELSRKLELDLKKNAYRKEANYRATGKVIYDEFYPKLSKPIIDEIDKVLAEHYGFTEEELDFIINYDIKYRMGSELGEEAI